MQERIKGKEVNEKSEHGMDFVHGAPVIIEGHNHVPNKISLTCEEVGTLLTHQC